MKALKLFASLMLAASTVAFVACSSKSKKHTDDTAYVPPAPVTDTTTTTATDTPTTTTTDNTSLGASSSGLSL